MVDNLVVLGATGDLTKRLLLPGLAQALQGAPDQRLTLIGAAEQAAPRWEEVVRAAFAAAQADGPAVVHCLETTRYEQLDATSASDLARLLTMLSGQTCLYFALPPAVTERACVALTEIDLPSDLLVALEKPVGTDLPSARRVNRLLARLAPEEHIFRVDHFLGMPGVLNLVGLRFGNRLFEPVWNREHIERIEIVFDEALGVEGRADFYDTTGAARDMIQSHLLQVMAVLMMDPPSRLDDTELRTNAGNVLRATHIWDDDSRSSVVRGRYTSGCVGDISLPSYVDEPGVRSERDTETFAQFVVEVDSWRWNGVPVVLRSGKAIGGPRQEIRVVFKQQPHVYGPFCERVERNVLRVGFEQEEVTLEVNVGNPSRVTALQRVQLRAAAEQTHVSAYGNVVRWLLEGNPAFMVRADGAEQGWRIVDTALAEEGCSPLLEYPAGSTGPS